VLTVASLSTAFGQFSPANVTLVSGSTVAAAQTLSNSGTVATNGAIAITSNAAAVTLNSGANLSNSGTIANTAAGGGNRRAITFGPSGTFTITNNATGLISAASQDAIQAGTNPSGAVVFLNNSGSIVTTSGQVLDFDNITTGSAVINNSGLISGSGAGAEAIRTGANATVTDSGTIKTNPGVDVPNNRMSTDDGVDTRDRSGVQIFNSGLIEGRHGVTGGDNVAVTITVTNTGGGILRGLGGSGINIDFGGSVAVVTNGTGSLIQGSVPSLAGVNNADGDGVDVDGALSLSNSGTIFGFGAKGVGSDTLPNSADGVAMGSGTVTNSGVIIGSSLLADAPNGDTSRAGRGFTVDNSSTGDALGVANITNSGTIIGRGAAQSYGIKITGTGSNFGDTITNTLTGLIQGSGTGTGVDGAVIQTGDGNDTVNNAGTIQRTGSNSYAIATESGNDQVNITGSTASVNGDIDGGSGTDTFAVAGIYTHDKAITNFETANVTSGRFTLSGTMTGADFNVSNGAEFKVNGLVAGGTGNSSVSGVLSGTGTIDQSVVVTGSGGVSAGNSIGEIVVADLEYQEGSFSNFEIGASTSDLITVTGSLAFSGSSTINVFDLGLQTTGTFVLFDYTSLTGFDNLALGILPTGWSASLIDDIGSSSVLLGVTAIPEPGTVALVALGLAVAVRVARRRSASHEA
jgi:hypothetical protein